MGFVISVVVEVFLNQEFVFTFDLSEEWLTVLQIGSGCAMLSACFLFLKSDKGANKRYICLQFINTTF